MKFYRKGVRSERELVHFLNQKGFSVSRTASSGGFLYPVDIVALKKGLILAFECKAHRIKPRLQKDRLKNFRDWCDRAGAMGFLAWRAPQNRWFFLRMEDAEKNNYGDENWIEMGNFLKAVDFRS
jgi:Holliday junction resolvase